MRRAVPWLLGFVAGLATGLVMGASPSSELRAAAAYAKTLPASQASFVRLASFYNVPDQDRLEAERVLSYVLNAVSRSAKIVVPPKLTGSECVVIDLAALGIPVEVWESLLDGEPFWHLATEVLDSATGKKKKVLTDSGALDLEEAKTLRETTGSGGALVRADWLVTKLSQPPHYYNAAGIATTRDAFYKSLGVDKNTIIAVRANHGANLIKSGVTRHPRRISRYQGPLGASWQTFDSDGTDAGADPLRNPTFSAGFQASEHIAAKANGLHLFFLSDVNGKRQDSVPERIAKDDSDPHGDGVLTAGVSCIRCHVEDGLRPFVNDQKTLDLKGVKILTDPSQSQDDLTAFYGLDGSGKLDRQLARDREDYAAALAQATGGMKSKELADAFAKVFREYEYELIDPARAKRELGVDSLEPLKATGDVYLLALANGKAIPRRTFEQSFNSAALAVKGQP